MDRRIQWRNRILILLMLCIIGIQIIESSHDHLSQAAQESCPVCQVIAHQPLDTLPSATIALALVTPLLIILPFRRKPAQLVESFHTPYLSRAPPALIP